MSSVISPNSETVPATEPNPRLARLIALGIGLTAVALLGLFFWGLGRRNEGTVGQARVTARPAPSVSLPLFDGGRIDLADLRGKPILINFWASWCEPCKDEAAALERASRRYAGRVGFLGIAVQDTEQNARTFLRTYGVGYPNGRDTSGEVSVEFGMTGVPETYFVDRDGQIVRKWQGPLDDAKIDRFLQELLG